MTRPWPSSVLRTSSEPRQTCPTTSWRGGGPSPDRPCAPRWSELYGWRCAPCRWLSIVRRFSLRLTLVHLLCVGKGFCTSVKPIASLHVTILRVDDDPHVRVRYVLDVVAVCHVDYLSVLPCPVSVTICEKFLEAHRMRTVEDLLTQRRRNVRERILDECALLTSM